MKNCARSRRQRPEPAQMNGVTAAAFPCRSVAYGPKGNAAAITPFLCVPAFAAWPNPSDGQTILAAHGVAQAKALPAFTE
jgi:hypothetical protein